MIFIRLAAILETKHGCRDQREDTDNIGPTPDHDDCHPKAGWVAAGDNRGLRERRSYPLLPLPSGQPKGGKSGARWSGVADDRSRHAGGDGDYRFVDGSARASSRRPGRSGQGLAHAADKISWALPAIAHAVPGKHQDLPRDADGHIRARLLEGLWTHGSGHLLSALLLEDPWARQTAG